MCASAYTKLGPISTQTHWLKSNCMHSLTGVFGCVFFSKYVSRRKHSTFHYIQIMFVDFNLIEVLLFSVLVWQPSEMCTLGIIKRSCDAMWRFFPPFELTQIFWWKNFISFARRGIFLDLIGFDRSESNWNTIWLNSSSHANDFNEEKIWLFRLF